MNARARRYYSAIRKAMRLEKKHEAGVAVVMPEVADVDGAASDGNPTPPQGNSPNLKVSPPVTVVRDAAAAAEAGIEMRHTQPPASAQGATTGKRKQRPSQAVEAAAAALSSGVAAAFAQPASPIDGAVPVGPIPPSKLTLKLG